LIVARIRILKINIKPFNWLRGFDKVSRFGPVKLRLILTANLTLEYNSLDVFTRLGKITVGNKMCQSCITWMTSASCNYRRDSSFGKAHEIRGRTPDGILSKPVYIQNQR